MIPILEETIRNLINLIQTGQNIDKVFSQKCILKPVINPEVLHAHAHDAKYVLSFTNVEKLSGPKGPIKSTDHFTCTSANVIYCITCTFC